MTIKLKEILSLMDREGKTPEQIFINTQEKFPQIYEEIGDSSEKAQEIILSKISEEDFVKLSRAMSGITMSVMMTQGDGMGLLLEHTQGSLDGFVHTVTLGIIGVLISEEVL